MVEQAKLNSILKSVSSRKEFLARAVKELGIKEGYASILWQQHKTGKLNQTKPSATRPAKLSKRQPAEPTESAQPTGQGGADYDIGDAVESDINVSQGEELKHDAANINRGFKTMLNDFEDVPGDIGQSDDSAEQPQSGIAGSAPQTEPSKPARDDQITVPYKFWFNLSKGFETFMYKERPLTEDELKPIEQTSDSFQSKYLGYIATDPNAAAFNWILAAGLVPALSRVDLVAARVVELFNWIRVMSGKPGIKLGPKGVEEVKQTESPSRANPNTPPPVQPFNKPTTNQQPDQIAPTVQTVPTDNPSTPAPREDWREPGFDPMKGMDYEYYQKTGKVRNKVW